MAEERASTGSNWPPVELKLVKIAACAIMLLVGVPVATFLVACWATYKGLNFISAWAAWALKRKTWLVKGALFFVVFDLGLGFLLLNQGKPWVRVTWISDDWKFIIIYHFRYFLGQINWGVVAGSFLSYVAVLNYPVGVGIEKFLGARFQTSRAKKVEEALEEGVEISPSPPSKFSIVPRRIPAQSGYLKLGVDLKSGSPIFSGEEGKPLGRDLRREHFHIVGATGCGKTEAMLALIAQDIADNRPLVVIDPKSDDELFHRVLARAYECGRGEQVRFFSTVPEKKDLSNYYNPLLGKASDQITQLVKASFGWSEQFYQHQAIMALKGVCAALIKQGVQPSLGDLAEVISNQEALRELAGGLPGSERGILESVIKSRDQDFQGLLNQLYLLVGSEINPLLTGDNEMDMSYLYENNLIYFFQLDVRGDDVAETLGRIILGDLHQLASAIDRGSVKKGVDQGHRGAKKVLPVYVDEAANFCFRGFQSFLQTARSAGIGLCLAHQSLTGDFSLMEGMNECLTNNTRLKYFFAQHDKDAEACARIIGTRKVTKQTTHVEAGVYTGEGSAFETRQFKVSPDYIRSQGIGQAVLFTSSPNRFWPIQTEMFEPEQAYRRKKKGLNQGLVVRRKSTNQPTKSALQINL